MITAPQPLSASHDLASFSCGQVSLDLWLRQRTLANQSTGASRTYVIADGAQVIGFYALASGSVAGTEAPGKIRRNMPEPIPVMVLGRLAIDRSWQGRQFGTDLLRDAVLRTMQAAAIGGIRALIVHAKDERGLSFYQRNGFVVSPIRPLTCFLPLHPLPGM